jgi:hypothetical protein
METENGIKCIRLPSFSGKLFLVIFPSGEEYQGKAETEEEAIARATKKMGAPVNLLDAMRERGHAD